jgi:hypothetical protein
MDVRTSDRVNSRSRFVLTLVGALSASAFVVYLLLEAYPPDWLTTPSPLQFAWVAGLTALGLGWARVAFQTWKGAYEPESDPGGLGGF